MSEKHLFAIFYENIKEINNKNNFLLIKEEKIIHRIKNILRLNENEDLLIFNGNIELILKIINFEKKFINCKILEQKITKNNSNEITLYLPILNKEYIEEVIYICGQQNINIQFVKYEKSKKINLKENFERFFKILISGCEQGKQFNIPTIYEKEISFLEMIEKSKNESFFFLNENGEKLENLIFNKEKFDRKKISFSAGPEAGLTENEIFFLKEIKKIKLTNFVLRSIDAINFLSIFLRSI